MTNDELIAELNNFIEVYKKYELDGPLTKHDHFGMHEETVLTRDSIHGLIEDAQERNIRLNTDELAIVDKNWQAYIKAHKNDDFVLVDLNRERNPKYLWWFWVDEIDELSEEELSTL